MDLRSAVAASPDTPGLSLPLTMTSKLPRLPSGLRTPRGPGLKPPDHHDFEAPPVAVGSPHHREEDIRHVEPRTAARENADDGIALAVEGALATEYPGIPAESGLPSRVNQQHSGLG